MQWMESTEYNMLCTQVYQSARNSIDRLDSNSSFSAMLEQKEVHNLPTAIITDIDETILLTLEYQRNLLKKGEEYSPKSWQKYIALNSATPISASREYFSYLSSRGIQIVYISNRTVINKDNTFNLLKKLGYPIIKDNLLLMNEKKDWTRNKTSRRLFIANKYRVIQLFGDHLKDFAQTKEEAIANKDKFGTSWFLLPNPIYGSWTKNSFSPGIITGKVVSVLDGDTIEVITGNKTQHRVRLDGIDAPEKSQPFGKKSTKNLKKYIAGKVINVHYTKKDKYGRILGTIYLNDMNINLQQIKDSFAWVYAKYCKKQSYYDAEKYAKQKKIGLWSDPIPPWKYRHKK